MFKVLSLINFTVFPLIGILSAILLSRKKEWKILNFLTYLSILVLLSLLIFFFSAYNLYGMILDYVHIGLALGCICFLVIRLFFPRDEEDRKFFLFSGITLSIIIVILVGPLFFGVFFVADDDDRTSSVIMGDNLYYEKQIYGNAFSSSGINIKVKEVTPFFPILEKRLINEPFIGDRDMIDSVKVEYKEVKEGKNLKIYFGEKLKLDTLIK